MRAVAVERATRQWIHRFVIRERLCPFAAASNILIRVDSFDDSAVDDGWRLDPVGSRAHAMLALAAIDRASHAVKSLLEEDVASHSSSNLFLVWPNGLDDLTTYRSFVALLAEQAGLHFASVTGEGSDAPAVAFPFHPRMKHADAMAHADFRFASPWPMAHIIPQAELMRARQQLRVRKASGKTCLLERNARLMQEATDAQHGTWDRLLAACRSEAVT